MSCGSSCVLTTDSDAFNAHCFCVAVEPSLLHEKINQVLQNTYPGAAINLDSHPNLFSSLPIFVSTQNIFLMQQVIELIYVVSKHQHFRDALMAWDKTSADHAAAPTDTLLGFDFHLDASGPHLIEINTNPGGALLAETQLRAAKFCVPEVFVSPVKPDKVIENIAAAVLSGVDLSKLKSIAIVDTNPEQQYLYPEFLLFQLMFEKMGLSCVICSPESLSLRENRLYHNAQKIDFVYNRLTDFALKDESSAVLRHAYEHKLVHINPNPHSYLMFADKRNLSFLSNPDFIRSCSLTQTEQQLLLDTIPSTQIVRDENLDELWAGRKHFFFKPVNGYGGRAAYRGDKLTKKVWQSICANDYIAQAFVEPSKRMIEANSDALKFDIRCYAYKGKAILFAARVYQGQTTNFRTRGGGFAPVFTKNHLA